MTTVISVVSDTSYEITHTCIYMYTFVFEITTSCMVINAGKINHVASYRKQELLTL